MGIQIYIQRRRKVLAPLAVLGALSIVALLAFALPKAEASGLVGGPTLDEPMRLLLSPAPIASPRFMALYAATYR